MIRLGSDHDGGYVLPASLVTYADGFVSMGLGPNWTFERDVHRMKPLPVHAYDHTISGAGWRRDFVAHLAEWMLGRMPWRYVRNRWHRWRDYEAFFSQHATHYRERIGARAPATTHVGAALSRLSGFRLLLKIDIDGAEWEILPDILAHQDRLVGLIIECHEIDQHLEPLERFVCGMRRSFELVHVHANNFCAPADTLELTFARRSLVTCVPGGSLPHPLDQPNDPTRPEYQLVVG
jgi:hypothetical protein